MKLKKELEELKCALGIQEQIPCTFEENKAYAATLAENRPLPEGVIRSDYAESLEYATFYTIRQTSLSKEELDEYVRYKQLKAILTIRNCVVFFTVLTAISIACGVIMVLSTL